MTLFDTPPMTSYLCSILTTGMALCCAFCEILNVEKHCDMKSRTRVNQGYWKWYHSKNWLCFPISVL